MTEYREPAWQAALLAKYPNAVVATLAEHDVVVLTITGISREEILTFYRNVIMPEELGRMQQLGELNIDAAADHGLRWEDL